MLRASRSERQPENEQHELTNKACGSKEFDSPPFPFPPSGGKPGAHRHSQARAGGSAGQKQSRWSRLRSVRKNGSYTGGFRPLAPGHERGSILMIGLYAVKRTDHLLIKPDILTC
jgi:hypothetical protein